MKNEIKKNRLYNIELLRIIAMLLIILTHTLNHGGILISVQKNSLQYFLFNFVYSFSAISVNLFVIIFIVCFIISMFIGFIYSKIFSYLYKKFLMIYS